LHGQATAAEPLIPGVGAGFKPAQQGRGKRRPYKAVSICASKLSVPTRQSAMRTQSYGKAVKLPFVGGY